MYGDQLWYNLLVDLIIILLLLMMQLEEIGFIALDRNMMSFLLLEVEIFGWEWDKKKVEMSQIW